MIVQLISLHNKTEEVTVQRVFKLNDLSTVQLTDKQFLNKASVRKYLIHFCC